ncbi:hypothetical protein GCM10023321_50770 [Pseudonocardia eucalypti]|uniref:Polyketide synthase dehydratase domain-containing protein n=1 Tax=Pseudonocardia eucalypti TaxID=648755 RepID=A0ABP9QLA5_9PSEU|nr:hypothetical protein [Pseudonocardia eucalypti]
MPAEQRSVPPGVAVVPVSLRRLVLRHRPVGPVWVHARLAPGEGAGDLTVFDQDGSPIIDVTGLAVRRLAGSRPYRDWLYELGWPGPRLLFADSAGVAAELATLLERRGQSDELDQPSPRRTNGPGPHCSSGYSAAAGATPAWCTGGAWTAPQWSTPPPTR